MEVSRQLRRPTALPEEKIERYGPLRAGSGIGESGSFYGQKGKGEGKKEEKLGEN